MEQTQHDLRSIWTNNEMRNVKESLIDTLKHLHRASIEAMIDRFKRGKVTSGYWNDETECGCFAGTAAYFYLNEHSEGGVVHTFKQMYPHLYDLPFPVWASESQISYFFLIEVPDGATPETNEALALVVKWMRDYLAERPE